MASFPLSSSLASEATGVLENANGDGPNVLDRNLRERPCWRERRGQ